MPRLYNPGLQNGPFLMSTILYGSNNPMFFCIITIMSYHESLAYTALNDLGLCREQNLYRKWYRLNFHGYENMINANFER